MNKTLQAKHVSDEKFLDAMDASTEWRAPAWAQVGDIATALGVPEKIVRAKAKGLIKRGVITGCFCGCRGDFGRVEGIDK